ncbi:MAG: hypothetical protein GY806_18620 [Gammaproteobacteria bacterium]|nr:hypothetical protein [Gammaproteobacteria bacterium]
MVYILIATGAIALIFLTLWLRERKNAQMEYIAYGLRSGDDHTESTKTNITMIESGFREAMSKLEDIGEVKRDKEGQWVWTKSGKPVGDILNHGKK